MAKHPCGSTSQGEPSPKKARKGSEAEASTQMPEIIPPGAEEQEEEEEKEAAPTLHPRGLRSRGPAILAEGEPVVESTMAEGVEQPEEVVERVAADIPGVSIQPETSSAQGRGAEVQQLGSPSVLLPTSRVMEPSPTTRILSGKAPITETFWVQLSSSSSKKHEYYSCEEVDFDDEPTLPDTSKFSHISKEEMQVYVPDGFAVRRDYYC